MLCQLQVVARQLEESVSRRGVICAVGKLSYFRCSIAPKLGLFIHLPISLRVPLGYVVIGDGPGSAVSDLRLRENGQVLNSDLKVDSPYNTYKVKGLPPTPITAAGRASLRAALAPEAGPWLFYVKFQSDGTHKFATTGDEQNRNVADARRRGVIP